MNQSNLSENYLQFLKLALAEDLEPCGDVTTNAIFGTQNPQSKLIVTARNQGGIMSGSEFCKQVYAFVDPNVKVKFLVNDKESFAAHSQLVALEGPAKSLLIGERLFLNLLQRAISIASYTKQFADKIKHTKAKVLDTRKTTPGIRLLEKAAVKDGGGKNHRFNLATGVLIKDNHIALAGGIKNAITLAKQGAPYLNKIEIEVDSIEQLKEVLELGVDLVLLDNFAIGSLKEAVQITNGKIPLEASGGVNLNTIKEIAETGVDYISVGSLTQSPPLIDIGLDFHR
jgi:nicotinate-nucleotide pyrophosphorylase (carboxylating)